jgi:thioredoxin
MMQWRANNFPIESLRPVSAGLSLEQYKAKTSGKLVLVDFYAPWCAPCKKMLPELAAISDEHKDHFSLLKINVDENNIVVRKMKIDALPVLILYKNGKVIWSANQYVEKADLLKILKEHF